MSKHNSVLIAQLIAFVLIYVWTLNASGQSNNDTQSLPLSGVNERAVEICGVSRITKDDRSSESLAYAEPTAQVIADKKRFRNSLGMEFVLIPAGQFKMGSSAEDRRVIFMSDALVESGSFNSEEPQHTVRITKPFQMCVYEVTQIEFRKIVGRNPSTFSPTGVGERYTNRVSGLDTSRFPVETVSWFDAVEFCNKLSESERRLPYYQMSNINRKKNGSIEMADVTISEGSNSASGSALSSYRLPTEAEWEYACRGDTTTPFHFGSLLNGDKANVDGTRPFGNATPGKNLKRPTTVDDPAYSKNAFGLAQMHGNVGEWCEDVYDVDAYAKRSQDSPIVDPIITSGSKNRVWRGGSWSFGGVLCRSAYRISTSPGYTDRAVGFRVVCWHSP